MSLYNVKYWLLVLQHFRAYLGFSSENDNSVFSESKFTPYSPPPAPPPPDHQNLSASAPPPPW